MRYLHLTRNQYYCPVINVEKLWSLVPEKIQATAEKRQDGKVPVLDVVRHVSITLKDFITQLNAMTHDVT